MTTDFPDKRSALATGCYYAGLKTKEEIDVVLDNIESTETRIMAGMFGDVKEGDVFTFKNCNGKEVSVVITEAGGDDIFHKGREGYHLWLLADDGMGKRV